MHIINLPFLYKNTSSVSTNSGCGQRKWHFVHLRMEVGIIHIMVYPCKLDANCMLSLQIVWHYMAFPCKLRYFCYPCKLYGMSMLMSVNSFINFHYHIKFDDGGGEGLIKGIYCFPGGIMFPKPIK